MILAPHPSYKESGVLCSDKIPSHWNELMLFQIASEQTFSNKEEHLQNLLSLSYGKIKRKDINTKGGLLPASFDTYQIVHNGNIVLRLTDLQNDHKSLRVGLATETGIITSAYTCLKPRDSINSEFLYYVLHTYDLNKVFYSMGGGVRQSIGYANIRRMSVALPPDDEQAAILRFLHWKISQMNLFVKSKRDEIQKLKELRISTLNKTVCFGIRNTKLKSSGSSWLREIPENWDMLPSKRLFFLRKDKAHKDDEQLTSSQKYGVVPQQWFMEHEGRRVTVVFISRERSW